MSNTLIVSATIKGDAGAPPVTLMRGEAISYGLGEDPTKNLIQVCTNDTCNYTCSLAGFGKDPAPHKYKACHIFRRVVEGFGDSSENKSNGLKNILITLFAVCIICYIMCRFR